MPHNQPLLLLFALVTVLLAPTVAMGSCGDWLQHSEQPAEVKTSVDSTWHAELVAEPALPSRSCHGPNCRNTPRKPTPVPATPSIDQSLQDAAVLAALDDDSGSLKLNHLALSSITLLSGHLPGIDRPPQA